MKAILPRVERASTQAHRQQVIWQIILPVGLSTLACLGLILLISLSTFQANGDTARWAAISTIWIVIPLLVVGLLILLLLGALIYLLARLLHIAPTYTQMIQDYVYRGTAHVRRFSEASVQPILFLEGLRASIKAFFRRK